jgi:hypothetical protein
MIRRSTADELASGVPLETVPMLRNDAIPQRIQKFKLDIKRVGTKKDLSGSKKLL